MKMRNTCVLVATAMATIGVGALMSGCGSMKDNDGSTLTTTPGQAITESMLLGKWDVDGELTNKANGNTGEVASDVTKDMTSTGWKFDPNGVLKIDETVGSRVASYSIAGNKLTIKDPKKGDQTYEASFKGGYLYVKAGDGKVQVFEKDKYFGM